MSHLKTLVCLISLLGVLNCSHSPEPPIDIPALKEKYQFFLARYLVKDAEVYNFIKIDDEGIKTFASDSLRQQGSYEFFLPWKELSRFQEVCQKDPQLASQIYERYASPRYLIDAPKPFWAKEEKPLATFEPTAEQPLKGLRIALDAGHIAGDLKMAKMEGKFIQMKYNGQDIAFWEADLAWHTSNYLHRQLEKHGAIIMTTRDYGKTAFGVDYDTWYKQLPDDEKYDQSKFFWRVFRHLDNAERIRLVNEFKPDLTLIMHYNVDGGNTNWKKPCKVQYSMAFTGGAYMRGELYNKERRFNLVRLLITNDIENSAVFSSEVLQILETDGGVPILPGKGTQKYVNELGIRTNYQGVFARNLALSGRIYGTLCYAEPLFQDHINEVLRLNTRDFNFEGEMIPSRVVEIAKVYEKAILKYAATLKVERN